MKVINIKKFLIAFAVAVLGTICFLGFNSHAEQIEPNFSSTDGSNCNRITDDNFNSSEEFEAGTRITIESEENIDSIYIKWEKIPGAWTLETNGQSIPCGANNFLHEFVKLPAPATQAVIVVPDGGVEIADVYAFSAGDLPSFVQVWKPSWDRADILVLSAHADDDVLFFGPLIETYVNENKARVQVVYFTNMALTENYRCHELLEGLWTMGVKNYPFTMDVLDAYSETDEWALENLNMSEDEARAATVSVIRRFKPQVLVLHDIDGEYGHGQHMLSSRLGREALDICPDASKYPDSANQYGVWDVPKCYIHLYDDKKITIDDRVPLSSFGGITALDLAKEAYLKHESQQGAWFYVDDEYEYSCAWFGLYRTLVGDDTGNDILEHITTYDEQDRIAREEAEAAAKAAQEKEQAPKENKKVPTFVWIIVICVVLIAGIILLLVGLANSKKRRRKRRRGMQRRR